MNLRSIVLGLASASLATSCAPHLNDPHHVVKTYIRGNSKVPNSRIYVDVQKQKLHLTRKSDEGFTVVKSYDVSTARNGVGNAAGTYKTPLGKHTIIEKIGEGVPKNGILKGRKYTGRIAKVNQEKGDLITTRGLWLAGPYTDPKRCIYIHGTSDEENIGRPVSYGCIRMTGGDVLDLYNRVEAGTTVEIKRSLGEQFVSGTIPLLSKATIKLDYKATN